MTMLYNLLVHEGAHHSIGPIDWQYSAPDFDTTLATAQRFLVFVVATSNSITTMIDLNLEHSLDGGMSWGVLAQVLTGADLASNPVTVIAQGAAPTVVPGSRIRVAFRLDYLSGDVDANLKVWICGRT